ncbi:MAG TPA: hypothetical protein VI138_01090 [Candidatus Dormibacteraeota bacterium]
MNHLLFGFALCAALAIYPGGLAALVAALVATLPRMALPREVKQGPVQLLSLRPGELLLGLGLAGLVLAPMPWPDNPLAPIGISWAEGSSVGGIALSLGGLWTLLLLGRTRVRRGRALALLGGWSLGLVMLGLAVHSGTWAGALTARGPGAELGRVALAVVGVVALALLLPLPPRAAGLANVAWAAGLGLNLLLALPRLLTVAFPLAILAWWGLVLVAALVGSAGARWGGKLRRVPGDPVPAATLNVP